MSSRIQADLQRIDAALKSCPNRAALKSGTTDTWISGNTGLAAVTSVYQSSVFSDRNSGAAPWIQWRKSNASKQLLGFMRAVMDTAMEADQGSASPTSALLLASHIAMRAMLHGCIALLTKLFVATQSAALWPAMREWLLDQGGIKGLWSALAQSMTLAERDSAAASAAAANGPLSMRDANSCSTLGATLIFALSMTGELQFTTFTTSASSGREELSLLPGLITSLTILFGDVLPRELAAGHADEWDIMIAFRHIVLIQFQSRSVGNTRQ